VTPRVESETRGTSDMPGDESDLKTCSLHLEDFLRVSRLKDVFAVSRSNDDKI